MGRTFSEDRCRRYGSASRICREVVRRQWASSLLREAAMGKEVKMGNGHPTVIRKALPPAIRDIVVVVVVTVNDRAVDEPARVLGGTVVYLFERHGEVGIDDLATICSRRTLIDDLVVFVEVWIARGRIGDRSWPIWVWWPRCVSAVFLLWRHRCRRQGHKQKMQAYRPIYVANISVQPNRPLTDGSVHKVSESWFGFLCQKDDPTLM